MIFAWVACTASVPDDAPPPLRFSAIPDHDTTLLKQRFDPFARHLEAQLGVPVEYVPATDYLAAVEMFKNGDVQLAWFGGLTGVQARRAVPKARAIAQGVEDQAFRSHFIVHRSVDIEANEDFPAGLKGRTFTFGAPASTSGRLMPEHFIREHTGLAPDAFFASPVGFSGAHDKTARLVASGQVNAGVLNYQTWDALAAKGEVEGAKIVWTTPTYADYNFTAHPDLERYGDGFTARLQKVLTDLREPALLGALSRSQLISASNEDFAAIERVAMSLDMVR
ncbi:MAG: putative selenate ABC transporter substrate-binding protein [Myxococcota bacterium]